MHPLCAQSDYIVIDKLISEDTVLYKSGKIPFKLTEYLKNFQQKGQNIEDDFFLYLYTKSLELLKSEDLSVKTYGLLELDYIINETTSETIREKAMISYIACFKSKDHRIHKQFYESTYQHNYYSYTVKDSLRAYFKLPDSLFAKREIFYGKIGLAYLMADLRMTDQIPEVKAFVLRNDSLYQAKKRKSRNYFDTDIDDDFYLHLTLAKFLVSEEIDYCITVVSNFIQARNILPYDYNYLFEWLAQVKHKKVIDYFEEELKNEAQDINASTGFSWPYAYTIATQLLPKMVKNFPEPDTQQVNFYKSEKNSLIYMKKFIKECQEWLKANKDTLEILK